MASNRKVHSLSSVRWGEKWTVRNILSWAWFDSGSSRESIFCVPFTFSSLSFGCHQQTKQITKSYSTRPSSVFFFLLLSLDKDRCADRPIWIKLPKQNRKWTKLETKNDLFFLLSTPFFNAAEKLFCRQIEHR